MAGRKQTSAAAKVAAGNPGHRPIPLEIDFTTAGSIGAPPDWLDEEAKKEFNRIVVALQHVDLLHSTDSSILASYAVAYSRWMAAEKQVAAEGTVLKVEGSQGQFKFIKHPALMVSAECLKQIIRSGGLLGLNPVDRARLSASPKQAASPFAALMGGEDDDE
jgi:P27 family predicted phage terminase small subunit